MVETPDVGPEFLKRQYAGVPMWGWIIGGVFGLFAIMKLKGGGTATASGAVDASAGSGDPGNIFFLPDTAPNPQSVTLNVNPRLFGLAARLTTTPGEGPGLKDESKIIALDGETWEDVTARAYGYADSYANAQPKDQQRIRDVAGALKRINKGSNAGPPAGQPIYFN